MNTPMPSIIALSGLLILAGSAAAQYLPPVETGEGPVIAELVGGRVQVTTRDTGELLVAPTVVPHRAMVAGSSMSPEISYQLQPDGYDIVYTFNNTTSVPRHVGRLYAGALMFGGEVNFRAFQYDSTPSRATWSTLRRHALNYPGIKYSPVEVLFDDEWAVGVSLLYPIIEYEHDIVVELYPEQTPDGMGYSVSFQCDPSSRDGEWNAVHHASSVPPGATHTYVVCVRFTNNPDEWIRTLEPYRDYFRATYGSVRYQKDPRPVLGITMAQMASISGNNPAGWAYPNQLNPSQAGWSGWADQLITRAWPRIMLWKPTGQYDQRRALNMPYQFTTRWLSDPNLMTAINPQVGLPRVADSGIELGLWWGHSASPAAMWNPSDLGSMDPDNPEHVALGFAELDLASEAGATCIGLDSYNHMFSPVWDLWRWMEMMQARYPEMKFIIEPRSCDVLHVLAGSFLRGFWAGGVRPTEPEGLYPINQPYILADFLVPGHETWLSLRFNYHLQWFGIPITPALVEEDMRRFAAMGYVPQVAIPITMPFPEDILSVDSSFFTIPEDLREGPFSGGSEPIVIRLPDGTVIVVGPEGSGSSGGQSGSPPVPRASSVGIVVVPDP